MWTFSTPSCSQHEMPCRTQFLGLAVAALLAAGTCAEAGEIGTPAAACVTLKRAAVTFHLSRRDLTGRYYCVSIGDNETYFLLGLRYKTTPEELVGSNLLGWYAVRRSDGTVLDYDTERNEAKALRPRPPFEK